MITDRMSSGLGEGAKRYGSIENGVENGAGYRKGAAPSYVPGAKTVWTCNFCDDWSPDEDQIKMHVKHEHPMENNLCAICAKQIDGWQKYAEHMKETHSCVLNSDGSYIKNDSWAEGMAEAYSRGLKDAKAGKPMDDAKEDFKAAYRQGYEHGHGR